MNISLVCSVRVYGFPGLMGLMQNEIIGKSSFLEGNASKHFNAEADQLFGYIVIVAFETENIVISDLVEVGNE